MKDRREFLRYAGASAAAAAGFPTVVKSSALGMNGAIAPSERVTLAVIGCGMMGADHLQSFLKIPEAQVVAVCDLDQEILEAGKRRVDMRYENSDCATYRAFEEVLSRRDIDAVSLAVPDHWHGIVSLCAARAGKDIYGEKPLAHNFHEGQVIVEAVERYKRIWQTGSWQRSREQFRRACELVRNGRLGKIRQVEVGLPGGHTDFAKTKDQTAITDPPPNLNYDRWLGPAPEAPYCGARVHRNWRWNLDYAGGQLMDWIGHHVDIAHWGLGFDKTGPLGIEGEGEYPPRTDLWNTATRYRVTARYPQGITMIIAGGHKDIKSGTKWIGENGWIWVDRSGIEAEPKSLLDSEIGPGEIQFPKSPGHYEQFIQCVKSRERTLTPAEVAFHSAIPGWLGQIAMLTGKKVEWDPASLRITNDPSLQKYLSREMRAPWQL